MRHIAILALTFLQCHLGFGGVDTPDVACDVSLECIVDTEREALALAIENERLYVRTDYGGALAPTNGGLRIFDIGAQCPPVLLGELDVRLGKFDVSASHVYSLTSGGIEIFDANDPSNIQLLEHWQPEAWQWGGDLQVEGGIAYLAGQGLATVSVENPGEPALLGLASWGMTSERLSVSDGVAAVLHSSEGDLENSISIVDCLNPNQPSLMSTVVSPTECQFLDIEVGSGRLFATFESNEIRSGYGVLAYDISEISSPKLVSQRFFVLTPDNGAVLSAQLSLSSELLCVGLRVRGPHPIVEVIDVSDPAHLRVIGAGFDQGNSFGLESAEDRVYVVGKARGVRVFNVQNCLDPCVGDLGADLDADGDVDLDDLNYLLGVWGTNDPVADIDGDGQAGFGDLNIVLLAWGDQCP